MTDTLKTLSEIKRTDKRMMFLHHLKSSLLDQIKSVAEQIEIEYKNYPSSQEISNLVTDDWRGPE